MGESSTDALLNGHVIKLPSTYLPLYPQDYEAFIRELTFISG